VKDVEEMIATRLDVLSWEADAKAVLANERPPFPQLASVKRKADLILQGKSETRLQVISGTEANNAVDARIREFAGQEINVLCGTVHRRVEGLFSVASSWNDRAEAVIVTLRLYGNDAAGAPMASPRLPAMVDLKRVKDLVDEYPSVSVDFTDFFQILSRILSNCLEWASSFTATFGDSNLSFEEGLRHLRQSASQRPEGIIMNPTRGVVDSLEELLVWYTAAKNASSLEERVSMFDLLVDGIEVLEIFSIDRRADHQFTVSPAEALRLLAGKVANRGVGKVLSRAKLQSNPLSHEVLSRMVDEHRDAAEGYPLLSLLHMLWLLVVNDFTDRCLKGDGSERSLIIASNIMKKRPLPSSGGDSQPPSFLADDSVHPEVQKLTEMIGKGELTETAARDVLADSKPLLRECLRKSNDVRPHLLRLKSQQAEFKGRNCGSGLTLDKSLEQQLDCDVKLFNWLVR
jgi:hypothetical protein